MSPNTSYLVYWCFINWQ